VTPETTVPPAPPEEPTGRPGTDEVEPVGGPQGWSAGRVIGLVVAVAAVATLVGAALSQRIGAPPGAGSVDVGFMQDMTLHHEQAVEMASIAAENATDPVVRGFAREVLVFQQREIGYMEALLEDWGHWPFDPNRTAMAWMGMPTPAAEMPGMQPEREVARLRDVTGPAADAEFLRRMTEHHRGGIHMAEYAAEHSSDERVRDLARRMAAVQRSEIGEYRQVADRLGVALP
jgi:uncharacterized protein (DUF305 family)